MEFCPELAVFHSSTALANQIFPGGLKCFTNNDKESANVVRIFSDCVEEITRGLKADISREKAEYWNLMLVGLSTWNTISSVPLFDSVRLRIPPHVVRLIRPLPEWNIPFYYSVIKKNGWIKHFVKVLDYVETSVGLRLINCLFEHFSEVTSLDPSDISVACGLIEYLCLVENKYLLHLVLDEEELVDGRPPQESTEKSLTPSTVWTSISDGKSLFAPGDHRISLQRLMHSVGKAEEKISKDEEEVFLQNLMKCLLQLLTSNVHLRDWDKTGLLCAVLNLITLAFGNESVLVLKNPSLPHDEAQRISNSHVNHGSPISDRSIQLVPNSASIEQPLCNIKLPDFTGSNGLLVSTISQLLPVAKEFANDVTHLSAYLCQHEPVNVNIVTSSHYLGFCRHVVVESYNNLIGCVDRVSDFDTKRDLSLFLMNLESTYTSVNQFVQSIESFRAEPMQIFERTLLKIQQKHPGAEDLFRSLVATDCDEVLRDPRWLDCIEDCCGSLSFSEESTVVGLLRSLNTSKMCLNKEQIERLQQAVVKAYRSFSLGQQQVILTEFYGQHQPSPFVLDIEDFRRHFSEKFRQLTSVDKSGFRDALKDFSCLVLQNPPYAISELVLSVLKLRQNADIFVEVLCQLPLLAKFESQPGRVAVFDRIRNHLDSERLSKTSKLYAIALCQRLLSMKKDGESLCCAEKFLGTCVFTRTSQSVAAVDDKAQLSSVVLTLNLVVLTFESLDKQQITWPLLETCGVIPLIVWVCHLLDRCRLLWSVNFETSLGRIEAKETASNALGCLMNIVLGCKDKISSVHIHWIWQQLSQMHWSVVQHVQPLFSDSPYAQLIFPDTVAALLNSPDQSITETSLFVLFDLCRISDDSMEFVVNRICSLTPDHVPRCFYAKLIYSLSQVLINSVKSDWFCVAKVLQQFIVCEFVSPKVHVLCELTVCRIFVDAMLLMRESLSGCSAELLASVWNHVVQCFAEYFKVAVLNCKMPEASDQLICCQASLELLLRLWCVVPESCPITLRTLIMKVSASLSAAVSEDSDSKLKDKIELVLAEINESVHL